MVVGGDEITWTFPSSGSLSTNGNEYTIKDTENTKDLIFVGGSSAGYKSGNYLDPGGATTKNGSTWTRYFILNITSSGKITFKSNTGNPGTYNIFQYESKDFATAVGADGSSIKGTPTTTVTTTTSNLEVQSSTIDINNGAYLFVTFPTKIYTEKVVWTPASNYITLTTTDNMAGWRAFNPDGQGYTLDDNTTAYIVEAVPVNNSVALVKTSNDGKNVYPNTPVILYTTSAADSHKMTLTAADIDNYSGTGNLLKVTTAAEAISNKYRLGYKSGDGNGVGFYPYSAASAAAGIVYLDVDSSNSARLSIISGEDGETTGVNEELRMKNEEFTSAPLYNLAGQKVGANYEGIVIVNGKKYINK